MLPRRRWLLQLGSPLAAIALATLLADLPAAARPPAAALFLPSVDQPDRPRAVVPATQAPPTMRTPSAAPAGARPATRPATACRGKAPPSRGPGAWWAARLLLSPQGTLVGSELRAGRPGAPSATSLRLPPASAVSGPVAGLVAVAVDDGRQSRIDLLSTAAGCVETIYRSSDVIRRAILDRGGRSAYFHLIARRGRTDLGVWRLRVGDGGPAVRIVAPFDSASLPGRRVGRIWSTELRLDATGRSLAVQSCGAAECSTRIVDLLTGAVATVSAPGQGALVGFDRTWTVTFAACMGSPCPILATLVGGGRTIPLADAATSASAVSTSRGLTVVATLAAPGGRSRAVSIDTASGRLRAASLPPDARLIAQGVAVAVGVEVAAGRAAVMPGPDVAAAGAATTGMFDGIAEFLAFDPALDRVFPAGEEAP